MTAFHNPSIPTQMTKTPIVALSLFPSRTRYILRHLPSLLQYDKSQLHWKILWKHTLSCKQQRAHEPAFTKPQEKQTNLIQCYFQM